MAADGKRRQASVVGRSACHVERTGRTPRRSFTSAGPGTSDFPKTGPCREFSFALSASNIADDGSGQAHTAPDSIYVRSACPLFNRSTLPKKKPARYDSSVAERQRTVGYSGIFQKGWPVSSASMKSAFTSVSSVPASRCPCATQASLALRYQKMARMPVAPYEACERIAARVSSLSLVRYRGNDYSVPTQYGHRQVWVKGYVHEVVIACASEVIARHERSYEREAVVFDPLHYLALLEQKTRALDQAAPLAGWQLPECFAQLRRLLEARLKKHGSREYVQVLRLLETFDLFEVTPAIEDALRLGTISFDAVRHLLLCRIERRPPRLDMENYPHLPLAQVRTTQAADYMTLLAEVCA
jgi:hypothetical protein